MAPKLFVDKTHACIFAMACHEKNLVCDSTTWKNKVCIMMWHFNPCHITLGPCTTHVKSLKLLSATRDCRKWFKIILLKM
jgi:hypothetical protein